SDQPTLDAHQRTRDGPRLHVAAARAGLSGEQLGERAYRALDDLALAGLECGTRRDDACRLCDRLGALLETDGSVEHEAAERSERRLADRTVANGVDERRL